MPATSAGPAVPAPPALTPKSPATARIPAADRVYAHVKEAVLDRTYEGGTLLTEGGLAEAAGVSRTPVREALLRLEAEGLIKLYPKKGALVLPVSVQEIADVVETRRLVEEYAVRKAVPAPPGLVDRLEELLVRQTDLAARGDLAGFAHADRGFHAAIVNAAGNRILEQLYDQMRDRQLRMGVAMMHAEPDRVSRSITEHAEILEAVRRADAEAAASLVHSHVSRVQALVRGA